MSFQKRSKEDYVKVGVRIPAELLEKQTDKALGFKLGQDRKLTWIPKSQATDWDRVKDGNAEYCTFAVPKWLFIDNELEDWHDENYVDIDAL